MRYLGHKPSPSHLPIAHDALWGNPQHLCRLLHAEPPEKSEFDDLGFARVDLSQRIQSFVNGDDLAVPGARWLRIQSVNHVFALTLTLNRVLFLMD